jgi:hypothetical protein
MRLKDIRQFRSKKIAWRMYGTHHRRPLYPRIAVLEFGTDQTYLQEITP